MSMGSDLPVDLVTRVLRVLGAVPELTHDEEGWSGLREALRVVSAAVAARDAAALRRAAAALELATSHRVSEIKSSQTRADTSTLAQVYGLVHELGGSADRAAGRQDSSSDSSRKPDDRDRSA